MSDTVFDNKSLDEQLASLAEIAWDDHREPDTFLLRPQLLGHPVGPNDIARLFGLLYVHANIWAPGLRIPASLPKITISQSDEQCIVSLSPNEDHETQVVVSERIIPNTKLTLLALAYEACQHIFDLSPLTVPSHAPHKRIVWLLFYLCGYGLLADDGGALQSDATNDTVAGLCRHLRPDEHRYAAQWCVRQKNHRVKVSASAQLHDDQLYDQLLIIFQGDRTKIERWVHFARAKHPDYSQHQIYDWILEDYYRANR